VFDLLGEYTDLIFVVLLDALHLILEPLLIMLPLVRVLGLLRLDEVLVLIDLNLE
jgi:hypothetical protein